MSTAAPNAAADPSWRELAIVGALSVLFALYTARKAGAEVDDLFITLAYARNIADGHGMVFQEGERILGVTTPLWCWLNALVMMIVPTAKLSAVGALALATASHVAAALGLHQLARKLGAGIWASLAAVGWLLLPAHTTLFGMEYGLATALAAWGMCAFVSEKPLLAGGACAMLALTRPEAAVLAVMSFGVLLVRRRWRAAARFAAPVAITGVVVLAGFTMYFGSPLPNTFSAKRMQLANAAEFAWFTSVTTGAIRYLLYDVIRGHVLPALLALTGAASMLIALGQPPRTEGAPFVGALLLAFVALHVAALTALGVAHYPWYLWPVWMMVAVAVALGMERVMSLLPATAPSTARCALASAIAAMLLVVWQTPWSGDPPAVQRARRESYMRAADAVNRIAAGRAATVTTYEIGALRFWLAPNVRILDEALLVTRNPTPGRFPTRADFVREFTPDMIVESHPTFPNMTPEQTDFQNQRRRADFHLEYPTATGTARYNLMENIGSSYGMIVVLTRESK